MKEQFLTPKKQKPNHLEPGFCFSIKPLIVLIGKSQTINA